MGRQTKMLTDFSFPFYISCKLHYKVHFYSFCKLISLHRREHTAVGSAGQLFANSKKFSICLTTCATHNGWKTLFAYLSEGGK